MNSKNFSGKQFFYCIKSISLFFFIEKYYNTIYKILYNASVKISKYRSYLQAKTLGSRALGTD